MAIHALGRGNSAGKFMGNRVPAFFFINGRVNGEQTARRGHNLRKQNCDAARGHWRK